MSIRGGKIIDMQTVGERQTIHLEAFCPEKSQMLLALMPETIQPVLMPQSFFL